MGSSALRPHDRCEWIFEPQILSGTFSDWPIEVVIYTRGNSERQKNPTTALGRLEYRVLLPNNNIVFLQYVCLMSLKNFQPLAPGNPPIIPPPFATALTTFVNRPSMRPPAPASTPARVVRPPTGTLSRPMKKGTPIPQATTPSSATINTQSALVPDEMIELANTAPFDIVDEVERSLLRIHSRNAIVNSIFESRDQSFANSAKEIGVGLEDELNKCKMEIEQIRKQTRIEQDRTKRLRTMQSDLLNQMDRQNSVDLDEALSSLQQLSSFRTIRRIRS